MDGATIDIEGTNWYYVELGSGEPVLYVHGNTGSSAWWARAMEVPGRRCVAPDLPNFGRSGPLPGPISIEAYAEALAAFIEARGLEGCVAVGHSLGGNVCQALAARRPELLSGLVLVDSGSPRGLVTPESHYPAIELMRSNRSVLSQALMAVAPSLEDEEFFQGLVDDACLMAPPAWAGNARALGAFDISRELGSWKLPVLVIWGRRDLIVSEAMARETAAAFPRARLEIVEEVGHSLIVEDPRRFLALLGAYLSELAAGEGR